MATTTGHAKGREENQTKDSMDKIKDAGMQMADKAKDAGMQMADKARDAVAGVGEMATHTAAAVGKKADDLTAGAGTNIKNWGETIAEKGPHQGVLGQATHAVAETLKEGGRYIEEAKLSGMADDVTQMIRRNPIPALFIGIGVGFLLGRAMRG